MVRLARISERRRAQCHCHSGRRVDREARDMKADAVVCPKPADAAHANGPVSSDGPKAAMSWGSTRKCKLLEVGDYARLEGEYQFNPTSLYPT
jgi:hypothetical protein